jgi:alpha-beta hydrolase superfamily lysophospholipase
MRHGLGVAYRELNDGLSLRENLTADKRGFAQIRTDYQQKSACIRGPFKSITRRIVMSTITTKDGTQIYYKEWGEGRPVVFSHGWPLSADAWEDQMVFLGAHGFRCIAHDRRGHCRSSQPWNGNEMDTYADDLADLVETLDLKDAIHVGHSTGGALQSLLRHAGRCISLLL